jgi:hypothetical protein
MIILRVTIARNAIFKYKSEIAERLKIVIYW